MENIPVLSSDPSSIFLSSLMCLLLIQNPEKDVLKTNSQMNKKPPATSFLTDCLFLNKDKINRQWSVSCLIIRLTTSGKTPHHHR